MKFIIAFALLLFSFQDILAQSPPYYTRKHFVAVDNPAEFIRQRPTKDSFARSYIAAPIIIWDVDDNNTTHIKANLPVLICIEGDSKNGKPHGIQTSYIIDSTDHSKRYKIWEQTYMNGKLNGEWRFFNLVGTIIGSKYFLNDSLHGKSIDYWIDGKSIMSEMEFFGGESNFISREYHKGGQLAKEFPVVNDVLNGLSKWFYPNGKLQEDAVFKNGQLNGPNKYYYPSGKVWIEKEYKQGKPWRVVANYTEAGTKRNAGTLKNGNGTIIYYNDDGTIRETVNYVNGEAVK